MFGMLSDEEIDALYAQMERPYSQEEVARFVRTPESRARRLLEETHYHNYDLIDLTGAWREYLVGTAPRPRDELARLLVPGRNAENAARDRLDALVDYFSAYPHGGVPRFPIFTFAMRSSFTLVAHLGEIHPTRHLDAARDSLRSFARLVAYSGEPTLRRDAFGESLRDAATSFLDACARNASELDIWLHTPPEERTPPMATHGGRRGSGLNGNRTERMVEQLAEFKAWLRDNPVNERDPAKTVGARANTYWLLHEKTMARDAKRTGEKRGFSSAKTLAAGRILHRVNWRQHRIYWIAKPCNRDKVFKGDVLSLACRRMPARRNAILYTLNLQHVVKIAVLARDSHAAPNLHSPERRTFRQMLLEHQPELLVLCHLIVLGLQRSP